MLQKKHFQNYNHKQYRCSSKNGCKTLNSIKCTDYSLNSKENLDEITNSLKRYPNDSAINKIKNQIKRLRLYPDLTHTLRNTCVSDQARSKLLNWVFDHLSTFYRKRLHSNYFKFIQLFDTYLKNEKNFKINDQDIIHIGYCILFITLKITLSDLDLRSFLRNIKTNYTEEFIKEKRVYVSSVLRDYITQKSIYQLLFIQIKSLKIYPKNNKEIIQISLTFLSIVLLDVKFNDISNYSLIKIILIISIQYHHQKQINALKSKKKYFKSLADINMESNRKVTQITKYLKSDKKTIDRIKSFLKNFKLNYRSLKPSFVDHIDFKSIF